MAIAFRSSANSGAGFSNNGRTVTKPTGVVADDVLVALVYVEPLGTAVTAPSGWTLHQTQDSGATGDFTIRGYWKRAGASEPADYTWTYTGNLWSQITIAAYSGCITTGDPVDIDGSQASASEDTSITAPSITTTVADAMLVFWGAIWGDRTYTPPTGMTERTGDNTQLYLADVIQASAGASGSKTATASATGWNAAILLALKPPAAGVTVTPAAATIIATAIDPIVILGSMTVTPAVAQLVALALDPAVVLGSLVLTPAAAALIATAADPVVILGSLLIVPTPAGLVAIALDPVVIISGGTEGVGCIVLAESLLDLVALAEALTMTIALAEALADVLSLTEALTMAVTLAEATPSAVTISDASCL